MENVVTTSGFAEAAPYLSGFMFVLLVLCALWLVIEAIGYRFRHQDKKRVAAHDTYRETAMAPGPAVDKPNQLQEEHLFAITAAVTLTLGSQHRLVSISKSSANWGREGRREHLYSHSFRY